MCEVKIGGFGQVLLLVIITIVLVKYIISPVH